MLASGQVFTRSDEKSLTTHTVTLAVTPEQVGILVAAKAKGSLNLSLRGVNDHEVVAQPKPKPEPNDEEKARRLKLEKELEEVKLALARKQAELPPPPPPHLRPGSVVKAPEPRYVLIYRPLIGQESRRRSGSRARQRRRPGRDRPAGAKPTTTWSPGASASAVRRSPGLTLRREVRSTGHPDERPLFTTGAPTRRRIGGQTEPPMSRCPSRMLDRPDHHRTSS